MIAPDCLPKNQHLLTGHRWCRDAACECECHRDERRPFAESGDVSNDSGQQPSKQDPPTSREEPR